MTRLTLRCVRCALLYLGLGVGLGALFVVERAAGAALRPLHAELLVWGWVTLLIYGFGYHMLPRFAGQPLTAPRLADLQSFLAIGGVTLAAAGWLMEVARLPGAPALRALGGLAQLAAALLFALLVGRLLRRRARPLRAM